jgi:protein-disulfide isomerase
MMHEGKSELSIMKNLVMTLVLSFFATLTSVAECASPAKENLDEVIQYAGKRFHVDSALIHVGKIEQVKSSCFWAIELLAKSPGRSLTLYLSPDLHHLTPDLYDMDVDPLLAERAERLKTAAALMDGTSPELGPHSAPITIVEFMDFQCPYCKQMADTLAHLRQGKGAPSDVKVVYRSFPLPIHFWAGTAAVAGRCVEKLQPALFWRFHDDLFEHQEALTTVSIKDETHRFLAQEHILDTTAIDKCMDDPTTGAEVEQDIDFGKRMSVTSTPTLFINGEKLAGVQSISQLLSALNRARSVISLNHNE